MTSFLDIIAHDDDSERTNMRVAAAVARKRVADRYSAFLANSTSADHVARLALIEDDVRAIVASVVEEHGGDAQAIEDAILRQLAGAEHLKEFQFKKKDKKDDSGVDITDEKDESDDSDESDDEDDGNPKEASIKEARRPKMCPYHSEVTDISLGSKDNQAGYNAMQAHAWGDKHCKGGYEGNCNFKPAMVTQEYWDAKADEYKNNAEQRRLEQENRVVEPLVPSLEGTEPIMSPEPLPESEGQGVTDINSELADAPSAVGEMALAHVAADAPSGAGGAVKRVKLPKADESGLSGPSPKIDKGTWNGLKPIDTEQDGSRNPTVKQDIKQAPKKDKKDFLDQTDSVTKQETLPTNTGDAGWDDGGVTDDGYSPSTWSENNGADPVTGNNPITHEKGKQSSDLMANPLRDIIESNFGGFLPASEVDSALSDFEG